MNNAIAKLIDAAFEMVAATKKPYPKEGTPEFFALTDVAHRLECACIAYKKTFTTAPAPLDAVPMEASAVKGETPLTDAIRDEYRGDTEGLCRALIPHANTLERQLAAAKADYEDTKRFFVAAQKDLAAAKAELEEARNEKNGAMIQFNAIKSTTQPLIDENEAQRDRIAELEQEVFTIKARELARLRQQPTPAQGKEGSK